jgi:glycogen debranching enzyme
MAQGSTLGAPRCCVVLNSTGAISHVYCGDAGATFFGAVAVHFWERSSRVRLSNHHGEFHIHPERQDHVYDLDNGAHVHEQVLPYNYDGPGGDGIPVPAVYYRVHIENASDHRILMDAYGLAELRGNTQKDVRARFDTDLGGIVAWNDGSPNDLRLFGAYQPLESWETTDDRGKFVDRSSPGRLAGVAGAKGTDPVGALHIAIDLAPSEARWLEFICVLSTTSVDELVRARAACPAGDVALARSGDYYWKYLSRSIIRTPNQDVNDGVLWAKVNMIRVQSYSATGWCFTNDPTRSNNSVGRDTAWMATGADYLDPAFARESLAAYFRLQEPSGKIVEYYDVQNGKTADYDLNVNDNTPLAVIALHHHWIVTGNEAFLREMYPRAVRAMDYMLSQRNDDGLVWCTSTKTSDWGIIGWRNVIEDYRISGASTEVNAETYAALEALATMASHLGNAAAEQTYREAARNLRDAINTHLVNPANDLYYLTIDVDGTKRTEVTADLVFPVLFGVAPPGRSARIIATLSAAPFWTDAGIRTVPRDDLAYGPTNGYGLLGGVWVAVTYWYAFAAAKFNPAFMAKALSTSYRHFSSDPRRNNTVPGQFSEWLHGEILVNQGMMLSPWDAPRYLWAAIEGAAGLDVHSMEGCINPTLTSDWRWISASRVPFRQATIAWIGTRMPDGVHVATVSTLSSDSRLTTYERDVSATIHVADPLATIVAFEKADATLVFIGNSRAEAITTAVTFAEIPANMQSARAFSTVWNEWQDLDLRSHSELLAGIIVVIDAGGFAMIDVKTL